MQTATAPATIGILLQIADTVLVMLMQTVMESATIGIPVLALSMQMVMGFVITGIPALAADAVTAEDMGAEETGDKTQVQKFNLAQ